MSFKFLFISLILFILMPAKYLKAENPPETLKAYFESFSATKKIKEQDLWLSPDKGYHIIGSIISTTLIANISMRGFDHSRDTSKIIGTSVSIGFGVMKEIYDEKKPDNRFSWKDLAANGVGVLIGTLLLGIQ